MKSKRNLYWRWIFGATVGIEFFEEEEGGTSVCVSLGFVRFLWTKDDVTAAE